MALNLGSDSSCDLKWVGLESKSEGSLGMSKQLPRVPISIFTRLATVVLWVLPPAAENWLKMPWVPNPYIL